MNTLLNNTRKLEKIVNATWNVETLSDEQFLRLLDMIDEVDPDGKLKVHGKNIIIVL